jgi:hypothetical protein
MSIRIAAAALTAVFHPTPDCQRSSLSLRASAPGLCSCLLAVTFAGCAMLFATWPHRPRRCCG